MTTEEDFHAALDANPADWQTRLVFADWLDDLDDPRGPGYRALGEGRKRPRPAKGTDPRWYWRRLALSSDDRFNWDYLGHDWHKVLCEGGFVEDDGSFVGVDGCGDAHCSTRREAEDCAALAFAALTVSR